MGRFPFKGIKIFILLIYSWLLFCRKKHKSVGKYALSLTNARLILLFFQCFLQIKPNALATPAPYAGSAL